MAPAPQRVRGASPSAAGIPRQSQGGGAGAGCPPCPAGHPKPQRWPCSASSLGRGGVMLAAGWSCPSLARTAASLVPTCRGLLPATPKSSPRPWRGPSRTRRWSHSPPSPSPCAGSSEVGRWGHRPAAAMPAECRGVPLCLATPTHATSDPSRLRDSPEDCLPGPVLRGRQWGGNTACPVAPARGGRQPRRGLESHPVSAGSWPLLCQAFLHPRLEKVERMRHGSTGRVKWVCHR